MYASIKCTKTPQVSLKKKQTTLNGSKLHSILLVSYYAIVSKDVITKKNKPKVYTYR